MDFVNRIIQEAKMHDFYRAPRVLCADGYSVSIQGGYGSYCAPKPTTHEDKTIYTYTEVELGFPNMEDILINEYAESPPSEDGSGSYEGTVYPYVPVSIVNELLVKHGFTMKKYDMELVKYKLKN